MSVKIGHASHDLVAGASGGEAGDQGKEVLIQDWYDGEWNVMLRPRSRPLAERTAQIMEAACKNDNIGYDQWQRNTLYAEALEVGGKVEKIKNPCECDCSSLVHVCCILGGANITYGTNGFVTSTMVKVLVDSGDYEKYTSDKYLRSPDMLKRGDILVREDGHTAMVLGDGSGFSHSGSSGSFGESSGSEENEISTTALVTVCAILMICISVLFGVSMLFFRGE